MIHVTPALVLAREPYREMDRLSIVYTESFGKVRLRFVGAQRPAAKLRALSEPMVWGEYRLSLRDGMSAGKAIGGSIVSTFPALRRDLALTLYGLRALSLLERLTPDRQPNVLKYRLATRCLCALEDAPLAARWMVIAFGLRLLEAAGYGLFESRGFTPRRLWEALHRAEFEDLKELPEDAQFSARIEAFLVGVVERITERPFLPARFDFGSQLREVAP